MFPEDDSGCFSEDDFGMYPEEGFGIHPKEVLEDSVVFAKMVYGSGLLNEEVSWVFQEDDIVLFPKKDLGMFPEEDLERFPYEDSVLYPEEGPGDVFRGILQVFCRRVLVDSSRGGLVGSDEFIQRKSWGCFLRKLDVSRGILGGFPGDNWAMFPVENSGRFNEEDTGINLEENLVMFPKEDLRCFPGRTVEDMWTFPEEFSGDFPEDKIAMFTKEDMGMFFKEYLTTSSHDTQDDALNSLQMAREQWLQNVVVNLQDLEPSTNMAEDDSSVKVAVRLEQNSEPNSEHNISMNMFIVQFAVAECPDLNRTCSQCAPIVVWPGLKTTE
uniref:Uncharacterized protein n=1 Tax=Timema genevievae TaxID=629358 RepID=A0A7R9K838_TIMGE|nr:unnamed protein product [Timema genevievae]